jgi:hypothetical protein
MLPPPLLWPLAPAAAARAATDISTDPDDDKSLSIGLHAILLRDGVPSADGDRVGRECLGCMI